MVNAVYSTQQDRRQQGENVQNEKRYRPSKTTVVTPIRLPLDTFAILERRAANHPGGVSGYARDRLTYDLTRSHHSRKNK